MADPALLELLGRGVKDWNSARRQGTIPTRPDLSEADLRGARLIAFDFSATNLAAANLAGARLTGAILDQAVLDSADLTGASLQGAKLRAASLHNTILRAADLRDADMSGADARNADFRDSRLDKCRLVHARLEGAMIGPNLSSAIVDDAASTFSSLPADRSVSIEFRIDAKEAHVDWPNTTILIEGKDVFGLDGKIGFDPDDLFSPSEPLVPTDPPRRVAVYRCSCGEPGCGCVAPVIVRVGEEIHWRDFRDFTGVYAQPDSDPAPEGGTPLPIPTLRFDAVAYEAEVERASRDRSWESNKRVVARLLRRILEHHETMITSRTHQLQWVAPRDQGWDVSFRLTDPRGPHQLVKTLTERSGDPAAVADELASELLAAL